jgi:F-type H+-transporting ATPase subunit b
VKRAILFLLALAFLPMWFGASVRAAQSPAQPAAASPTAAAPATAAPSSSPAEPAQGEHHPGAKAEAAGHEAGEAESAESPLATIARLFNFALLAGSLIYLLRSPFGAFLENRRVQIRKELTDAAQTRVSATEQLQRIEEKLKALPSELASLRERGAGEIAAEEARIRQAAEQDRARMLENATREIGRRAQLAERRLLQHAGDLAVSLATDRVTRAITDEDQRRLVDRYLDQVRPETMGS